MSSVQWYMSMFWSVQYIREWSQTGTGGWTIVDEQSGLPTTSILTPDSMRDMLSDVTRHHLTSVLFCSGHVRFLVSPTDSSTSSGSRPG